MTDRELMQQALDALEQIKQETFHPAKVFAHNHAITALRERLAQPYRAGNTVHMSREQMAELFPQPERSMRVEGPMHVVCQCDKCKAQPEQEPVAWTPVSAAMPKPGVPVLTCYKNSHDNVRRIRAKWVPAKTQEAHGDDEWGEYDEEADTYWTPEGWYECIDNWGEYSSVFVGEGEVTHWMPMPPDPYTTPPRREWVGLTEEDVVELWNQKVWYEGQLSEAVRFYARAIEAKLKEKNA